MSEKAWQVRPAGAADRSDVLALIARAGLPIDDIGDAQAFTIAVTAGRVVGTAATERYGDAALLRSVAVDPPWRGQHIAATLVDAALADLGAAHITRAYLLTTTAVEWFAKHGFVPIARTELPERVATSPQAARLCPASATVMVRTL